MELQNQFSQRIKEVEARFSGDQEAVSERFQADVCKLEQHYQSELVALTRRHAADRARWEEEMEAAVQEAEQQRRLLREALQLERENMLQEFTQEQERVKHSHVADVEALREKNLQLQNELENFVSLAQTKEIELSRQLNELHNRLQENLEAKDTLLAHTECRAEELEQLLTQATHDFAQERAELQNSLSELEGRHAEMLLKAERQVQEQSDLLAEREELRQKMEEVEKVLHQAIEDFHYERLELQGIMAVLEEKLKESECMVMMKEEQRTTLLAERDRLVLRVLQMESELGEANRRMAASKQEVPLTDLPTEVGMEFLTENFIVTYSHEEETADHHSEDFSVLGEDSPSAQDEELEGELLMQKENSGDFEDTQTVSVHMLKICNAEILNCPEDVCIDSTKKIEEGCFSEANVVQQEPDEPHNLDEPGSTDTAESTDEATVAFAVQSLAIIEEKEELDTDHEGLDSNDSTKSTSEGIQTTIVSSDLIISNNVAGEDSEVREPEEQFPGIGTEGAGLFESPEDEVDVCNSTGDCLEEDKGAEKDKKAHVVNPTAELDAELTLAELDGSTVSVTEMSTEFENSAELDGVGGEEMAVDDLGIAGEVKGDANITTSLDQPRAVKNNGGLAFMICAVSEEEFSNLQDMDHTDDLMIDEGVVAHCTVATGFQNPEENGDEPKMTDTVEDDHAKENEAPDSPKVISDVAVADNIEESDKVEVADQHDGETSCCKASRPHSLELLDKTDMKDGIDDSIFIAPQDSPEATESVVQKQQEETPHESGVCARELLELQEIAVQFRDQSSLLEVLQDQYSSAVEQNLCLQEKLARLQQHTDELELLLDLNSGSHDLRLELVTMAAQAKELEIKELELAELQKSYEECICENVQLSEQNRKLEKKMQNLESKMHNVQEFHKQQTNLLEEIARMREQNAKLSTTVQDLEKQDEIMLALQQDAESSDTSDDSFMDRSWASEKITAVSELEDCCSEFEKQNSRLRSALTHLQEKSLRIRERMQDHRYCKWPPLVTCACPGRSSYLLTC